MAPLPVPDPSLQYTIYSIISKISSFFKSNPDLNPLSITHPVEVATVQIMDWGAPSMSPTTTTLTPSELPVPAGLEFKPSVPETETWLEISDPETTDGLVEFVSDQWNNNGKRSSIMLFS